MMEVEAVMNNVALAIGVHSKPLQHEGRLMMCPLLSLPTEYVKFALSSYHLFVTVYMYHVSG